MDAIERYQMFGRFLIVADTQEECEAAMDVLERAVKRARSKAEVDITVHASEAIDADG